VAKARGVPRARIALAWLLAKPVSTAPIVVATKVNQLEAAVAAVAVLEEPSVPHAVVGFA
jgi:aryl-alcohol dehydrogenase (NADP+)